MCGIAGIFKLDGSSVSPPVLNSMTESLEHRGPDGKGHWIEGEIGLGHRRLAIIDLSTKGRQPMLSDCGRYVMVYNGEVYNFRELRAELERKGYQFRSATDSEVVLASIKEWGVNAITKFNGMFALALWDRREKVLFVARDRYGIKPLYIACQGSTLSFASEQKAILSQPEFKRNIDYEALYEYLTFQNIFTKKTLLKNIMLLPQGHYATIRLSDGPGVKLKETKYWDYHFREPNGKSNPLDYAEELNRLFIQAVNRQLISDVEVGSYLSGGIDSGSITSIATISQPYLKTFTCGFDLSSASGLELSFDERAKAEAMSAEFKTEHYQMVLKAGDMERALPRLVHHLEEPRVGQSYPNFYVSQLASKFVKVVLSGTGGDELFAGYPWRYYRAGDNANMNDYVDSYYAFWQRLTTSEDRKNIFSPVWEHVKSVDPKEIFSSVLTGRKQTLECPEDFINESLYFEAKTFLHSLFVVEDKLSMAHSMESRVPFMDNDLVDFAMTCPISLKLSNLSQSVRINENEPGNKPEHYFSKTADGKLILRNIMERHIPLNITKAPKQGFSPPDESWFRGESIDFVRSKLTNKYSRLYQILDYQCTAKLVKEHLDGKRNRRLLIWSLLYLDEWLTQWS